MSDPIQLEVIIRGILGTNSHTSAAHPNPLHVPIAGNLGIREKNVETTSPKISSDPNVDTFNHVGAYPVLLGLEGGAFNEFHDVNARKYFQPYHKRPTSGAQTTIVQPLLWTLDKEHPLMVGCEHKTDEDDGTSAHGPFDQYISYRDKLYALDKTNNKVWKLPADGSDWVDITPSYTTPGNLTQLSVDARNLYLVLGTRSAKTHYINNNANPTASDWANFASATGGKIGSHHVIYGNDFFYASKPGSSEYMLLKRRSAVTKKEMPQYVGYGYTNINNLLWADGYICVTKPEGFFVVEPKRKQGAQLPMLPFPNIANDNGQVLFLHGRDVYFSAVDGGFFSWNLDGGGIINRNITRVEGHGRRPFLYGRVLAGMSDGERIYLVYRLINEDASGNTISDYYLLIGDGENWHPVHAVSVWGTGTVHAAVHFQDNRLRYSMGGVTGYLRTDGRAPMAANNGSFTYSTDSNPVGIESGWIDLGRDWLPKWWWKCLASMIDRGSKGVLKLSYKLWGETSWTTIGTITGTKDNAELALQEVSTTLGISNVVGSKINFLIELRKADSSENSTAHYLSSLHVVGLPFYEPAFMCAITADLTAGKVTNEWNDRRYEDAETIDAALVAAQAQPEPMQLELPDGRKFYGTFLPGDAGKNVSEYDPQTGKPRKWTRTVVFVEHK